MKKDVVVEAVMTFVGVGTSVRFDAMVCPAFVVAAQKLSVLVGFSFCVFAAAISDQIEAEASRWRLSKLQLIHHP